MKFILPAFIHHIKQFLNKKCLINKKIDINGEINYWMERIFGSDFKSKNNLNNIKLWKSTIKHHESICHVIN